MDRLLDVPAERGAGFGVFDNGGPDGDAGALAKSIKLAAISAYGTAGPEFVRRLIADGLIGDDVRGLIAQFVAATVPAAADGQVERAAERLGLVAASDCQTSKDWRFSPKSWSSAPSWGRRRS